MRSCRRARARALIQHCFQGYRENGKKNASAVIRIIRFTAGHLRLVPTVRQPRSRDEKAILEGISSGSDCFLIFSYLFFQPGFFFSFFSRFCLERSLCSFSHTLSLSDARVRGNVSQCSLTIFRVVGHFRFRWIFDSRGSQRTIVFDVGVIRR